MKRRYLIAFLLLFTVFSLLPIILFITWLLKPAYELKVAILDKTAVTKEMNEHKSLDWVLDHEKFCKPDRSLYSSTEDYYGFFPLANNKFFIKDFEGNSDSTLRIIANKIDLMYVTDTYGVYDREWYHSVYRGEFSNLIYGGMSQKEFTLLKILKEEKKLVLTEYNTFATPTPVFVRTEFENTFGLKWTGWAGRFIDDLDTTRNKEIPIWLINDYKTQHNNKWPFNKSGIVFVHENGRVEVLEFMRDLKEEIPSIFTNERNQKRYGVPAKIKYSYWFDVVLTKRSNNVSSVYYINSNARGDSLLNDMKIPNPFPAVIEHTDDYKFYYFCGDFSDNPIDLLYSKFAYITLFHPLFYSESEPAERESFFWRFYQPMITTILKNYYYTLPNK